MVDDRQNGVREAVASHYDGLDWFYRSVWGEHIHHGLWSTGGETPTEAVAALTHRVATAARIRPGMRVCDVGCGYGGTARLLARDYHAEVVGLTISPAQHAYAERAMAEEPWADRVSIRLEDWQDNRLPASSFDAVIAIECVSHMTDQRRFFEQVGRVLRPGGRAVICAWLAAEDASRWQHKLLLQPIHRDGKLARMLTQRIAGHLLREARLRLIDFDDLSQQVSKTWPCVLRRFLHVMFSDPEARLRIRKLAPEHRRFAIAALRIWTAYRVGCMRYGLFVIETGGDQAGDVVADGP